MSTRGLLVRLYGGMAIGIAAVVLVMGCAAAVRKHAQAGGVLAAGQERGSWASPAELAWLRRLGVWETALMRSLDRAAHAHTNDAAAGFAGPIRSCTNDLHESVGNAPTARLRRALRLLDEACAHLEDAVTTTSRSEERRVGKECRSRWSPYH